jgi:sigma-B regulation protein RsbU (phosphoserine phosphatase)
VKFPLRRKLIVAICLPLLAVYLTVLTIEYRISKREALEQMETYLTEVAARDAIALDKGLSSIAQVAQSSGQFLETFRHRESTELEKLARDHLGANPQIFGIGVALESPPAAAGNTASPPTAAGNAESTPVAGAAETHTARSVPNVARYVCRTRDGKGLRAMDITAVNYDYTRSDWYLLPKLLRQPAWTDPYFDEGLGGILMCSHSVPLLRGDAFEGVVVADVSLERIRSQLAPAHFLGEYRFVVSRSGTYVYHPNESYIMAESVFSLAEWHNRPDLTEIGHHMIAGGEGVARILDPQTSQPKWCAYANVPTVGWTLAAMIPEQEALASVHQRLQRELFLFLGGLGMILCVIVLVSGWITKPLSRLMDAAQLVAQGNLDVQVEGINRRDEIGKFASTFNKMVVDLKANVEATIRETNARQAIEKELQVARQIQTSLLPMLRPPFPNRHEFSLHADNEPALFMAGDFFDFWLLDEQNLAVVIADVSGKGVPAAMFMAVARTTLRNFSTPGIGPGEVLNIANRLIVAENEEMMFVTIFYGHYHIPTGELVFANAGHNPPYLVRRSSEVICLEPSTGPMLGVFPGVSYGESRCVLEPDDLLVMYTDGVTEAQDAQDKLFGESGLIDLLKRRYKQPVGDICHAIIEEVNEHRRHEGQDDVTLVLMRRSPDVEPSA